MQHSRSYHSSNCLFARSLWALPLFILGCSSDQVELGGSDVELTAPPEPACGGGIVDHDVTTYEQADIDALAGCREIHGKLWLLDFPGMDLSPLASLQNVRDTLYVGMSGNYPVQSLHGLEALEHVGGLQISKLLESDLSGLRNLREVRMHDPGQGFNATSRIELDLCDALVNLRGLEQLEDWEELIIQGAAELRSLDGLRPTPLDSSLWVMGAPQLRDLSALRAASGMDMLRLNSTGVENFDGVDLEHLGYLELSHNPALVQLDGLEGLRSLNEFDVFDNDALQRLPQLAGVRTMSSLQVSGNDSLLSVPAYQLYSSGSYDVGGRDGSPNKPENVPVGLDFFVIGNNAALRSASAPSGVPSATTVAVYDNPSLTALDLRGLPDIDTLTLRGNASLATVELSELPVVKKLEVLGNPQLPLSTFDGVAAAVKQLSSTSPQ